MSRYILRTRLINRSKVDWTDYNCNHYRGCAHNCQYPCYARKLSREKKEQWVKVRVVKNALELAVKEILRVPPGATIMVSSMCDPYQPIEETEKLTRSLIPVLAGFNTSCVPIHVIIITKSDLVMRDFDLISEFPNVSLCMTVTSVDNLNDLEPGAPGNRARIACLKCARNKGIPTIASVEPWIPQRTKIMALIREIHPYVNEVFLGSWNHHFRTGSPNDLRMNEFYRNWFPHVLQFLQMRMKKVVVKKELQRRVQN